MVGRKRFPWGLLLMLGVLPACSTFSPLVRHSDSLTAEQHMLLGASYEAQGLTDSAAEQYDAALHLEREHIPAHIARGNLAFATGDLAKAATCYRQVLRLDRNHAGANNNLAMVYLTRGKELDKAKRYAKTALKQGGPLRPYVLDTLASLYAQEGSISEARIMLDEADAAAPADNQGLREQLALTRKAIQSDVGLQ